MRNMYTDKWGMQMKIAVFVTGWNSKYLDDMYKGMEASLKEFQDTIHVYTCYAKLGSGNSTNKAEFDFYKLADLSEYDGVILPSTTIKEGDVKQKVIDWIQESGKPCVTLEERIPGFSSIEINQWDAMRELVDHLAQKHGIKSFGYLGSGADIFEARMRKKAVLSRVEELGLWMEPEWIGEGNYTYEDGMAYGKLLVEAAQEGRKLPEAVVSANDLMAAGIIDMLKGTPLYGKIAITGFDQYFEGRIYYPSITTIARPCEEVAYEGIRLLHELVETGQTEPVKRELTYRFFVGDTCGCKRETPFDNIKFRNEMFQMVYRDASAKSKLDSMQERMTNENALEEMMQAIADFLDGINAKSGAIYLTEHLTSSEQRSYRECRRQVLDWHSDKLKQGEGGVYVFMPLHYMEHRMGYCRVSGAGMMFQTGILEAFFRAISYAIENYIQRRQYHDVNDQLQRLYRVDQLTEIYNRFGMEDLGQKLYHRNCINHVNTVFIFCDVNRLKYINDTYGHEAGDWVIKSTGKALAKLETQDSIPFRYGGDEFILITTQGAGVDEKIIREELREVCKEAPIPEPVEISIGVVTAPWDAPEDMDAYLHKADEEMYKEKKRYHAERKS